MGGKEAGKNFHYLAGYCGRRFKYGTRGNKRINNCVQSSIMQEGVTYCSLPITSR